MSSAAGGQTPPTVLRTVVVCGNPKAGSRTLGAATVTAELLSGAGVTVDVVDLADLGAGLLGWGDPAVGDAVSRASAADLLVVASPTFKATYTGLLKLFLDQFAGGEGLRGVTAVPLMLGAGPVHALAPDLLLGPVLRELGAAVPSPGLYLIDKQAAELGAQTPALIAYANRWGPVLRGCAVVGRKVRPA